MKWASCWPLVVFGGWDAQSECHSSTHRCRQADWTGLGDHVQTGGCSLRRKQEIFSASAQPAACLPAPCGRPCRHHDSLIIDVCGVRYFHDFHNAKGLILSRRMLAMQGLELGLLPCTRHVALGRGRGLQDGSPPSDAGSSSPSRAAKTRLIIGVAGGKSSKAPASAYPVIRGLGKEGESTWKQGAVVGPLQTRDT